MKGPEVVLTQPPVIGLFVSIDSALSLAHISQDEYAVANFLLALHCGSSQGRRWYQSASRRSILSISIIQRLQKGNLSLRSYKYSFGNSWKYCIFKWFNWFGALRPLLITSAVTFYFLQKHLFTVHSAEMSLTVTSLVLLSPCCQITSTKSFDAVWWKATCIKCHSCEIGNEHPSTWFSGDIEEMDYHLIL